MLVFDSDLGAVRGFMGIAIIGMMRAGMLNYERGVRFGLVRCRIPSRLRSPSTTMKRAYASPTLPFV